MKDTFFMTLLRLFNQFIETTPDELPELKAMFNEVINDINIDDEQNTLQFKQKPSSSRIYMHWETDKLSAKARGLLVLLQRFAVIDDQMREEIIDEALDHPSDEISVSELRPIIHGVIRQHALEQDGSIDAKTFLSLFDAKTVH